MSTSLQPWRIRIPLTCFSPDLSWKKWLPITSSKRKIRALSLSLSHHETRFAQEGVQGGGLFAFLVHSSITAAFTGFVLPAKKE